MFVENNSIQNQVADLAATSCVELFNAYNVELTSSSANPVESDNPMISSVMGFVGPDIRGTLLLAADYGPLLASRPCEGRLRDWAGELTNQIVGCLKSKLLARGTDVALSTPVVLQGLRVQPLPKNVAAPAVFASVSGLVWVWIELETMNDFELAPEGPPQAASIGEIRVF